MVAPSEGGAIPWPLGATSCAMRTRVRMGADLVWNAHLIGVGSKICIRRALFPSHVPDRGGQGACCRGGRNRL